MPLRKWVMQMLRNFFNSSIPTPQPVLSRPMFGAHSSVLKQNCLAFVSKASVDNVKSYGLRKRIEPIKNVRNIGKSHMKLNNTLPRMTVDPETYQVHADGVHLNMTPAESLPMTQTSYLF